MRPGTGRRVSSGGAKIVFSDTNTYGRNEMNYRVSGVVDAMRLPKDAYYVHQVMWDGWVSPETDRTYIVGHWNYDARTVKPVYVASTADEVELLLNGRSLGRGRRSYEWLFTFDSVRYEPGTLTAVGYEGGRETSRHTIETAGEPARLVLTAIVNPEGMKADGADPALVQVEVVDSRGRRCPLDNRDIRFCIGGPAEWLGGIARRKGVDAAAQRASDNYLGATVLPVECGVNRVFVRSATTPGTITVRAEAEGLPAATLSIATEAADAESYLPQQTLPCRLDRGPTPPTPSFADVRRGLRVVGATAGSNQAEAGRSFDGNELSQWQSDGSRDGAWIEYRLERKATVRSVSLKLTGWRSKCYPLQILAADGTLLWEGITPATLGYVNIDIPKPVATDGVRVRMVAPVQDSSKFGIIKELAGGATGELYRLRSAKGKTQLRIVEADFAE